MALFLLLIFHIFTYLFRIQTNGIDTVTSRPEMITPIRFLLQMSKLIENSNSCSAFDYTYKIGYRYLGYYHDKQMNMVNLYIYSGCSPLPKRISA
ncbi:hypothetical protein KsCSTR_27050 [Candidatus Kuenenia stuttgartiensis]|uniref:Uncharacterized protein n=1 Tax=Kuenenia stuttgartiensis TaxID=174633 RepID=Q1Q0I6_KUEST|nr:hypothetical protein KsCSTR_27050 [Candidatus Kuenenia stuttgartiensis]CAJ73503.1 unknown protein [Candidatus Kuenenia stuttgartiensis]